MAKKTETEKAKEILSVMEEKQKQVPVSETQKKQIEYAVNFLTIVLIVGSLILLIIAVMIFLSNFEIVLPV